MARGDEADDIVVVGIIIDARDPRRVGGAGVGERSEGNVTSEEKEDEQTPDSHIAEPTTALLQGQASARGVLLDYDLQTEGIPQRLRGSLFLWVFLKFSKFFRCS